MKKILQKALPVTLALCMMAGVGLTASAAEEESDDVILISAPAAVQPVCPRDETCPLEAFADTQNDGWYHDGIHYCVENGLMKGTSDTKFAPKGTTDRAMVATILYRVAGEPAFMNDNVFSDVPSGSYYEKAIVWANGKGIVEGFGNGLFKPDAPINREQLATMLTRIYKKVAIDGWTLETDSSYNDQFKAMFTMPATFADDAEIDGWAKDSVYFMKAQGIIDGVGNNMFAPKHGMTAGQAASYGLATREQALKIAVGMVQNLK